MSEQSEQRITVPCPGCGKRWKVSPRAEGRTIRCKQCQTAIPVEPVSSQPAEDKSPLALFFALAGLLALIGAAGETVFALGTSTPETFVRSAIGCSLIGLAMIVVAVAGRFFLSLADVPWLRFATYFGWAVVTVVLTVMFLIPGWSYEFPLAPAGLVSALAEATPTVIAAVLLKYLLLTVVIILVLQCVWGEESPVRGLTRKVTGLLAQVLWLPVQLVLWTLSAPRVWWIRATYPRRISRLDTKRSQTRLDLGRSAETVLGDCNDVPEGLVEPFEAARTAGSVVRAKRQEFGLEETRQGGLKGTFEAAKAKARSAQLTTDQRSQLDALEAKHEQALRELAEALLTAGEPTAGDLGLGPKVNELRQLDQRLDTLKQTQDNASYRLVPFHSLPAARRRKLTMAAGAVLAIAVVLLGLFYPDPLRAVGRSLFRNPEIEKLLASMTPPWAQLDQNGDQEPVVMNGSNGDPSNGTSGQEDGREEGEEYKPPSIHHWPLLRQGRQLVWHSPRREPEAKRLGFIDAQADVEHVYFREVLAPLSRSSELVPRSQIEELPDDASVQDAWQREQHWLDRLLWRTARRVSIPEGRCIRVTDDSEATINLNAETPFIETGSELHAVRLVANRQYLDYENLGTVTVEATRPDACVVAVPEEVDLQEGDWVFPVVGEKWEPPRVSVEVTADTGSLERDDPQREAVEKLRAQKRRALRRRLQELGADLASDDTEAGPVLSVELRPDSQEKTIAGFAELHDNGENTGGIVFPEVVLTSQEEIEALAAFPHLPVSGRPVSFELLNGERKVGWFDPVEAFGGNVSSVPEKFAAQKTLTNGPQTIPIRDPFSHLSEQYPREEILPGSLRWLDAEDFQQELPFSEYVAWHIARKVAAPSLRLIRPKEDDEQTLLAWAGTTRIEGPPIASDTRLISAGSQPRELKPLGWYGGRRRALRVKIPAENVSDNPGYALVGKLPSEPPRILFLDSTDNARTVQRVSLARSLRNSPDQLLGQVAGAIEHFVNPQREAATDPAAELQFQRWGRMLNNRIIDHLSELNFRVVSEDVVNTLRSQGLISSDGQLQGEELPEEVREQVTHVVLTHLTFADRPDTAHVTVKLIDLTGEYWGQFSEEGIVYIEDIFPKLQRHYRQPPYLLAKGPFCRFESEGRQHVAQLAAFSDQETLLWMPKQQAFQRLPKEKSERIQRFPEEPIEELKLHYESIVDRVGGDVAGHLCPKIGRVSQVQGGTARITLGQNHGLTPQSRLTAARLQPPTEQTTTMAVSQRPVAQLRVAELNPLRSTAIVPARVRLQPGDFVRKDYRYPQSNSSLGTDRMRIVVHPLKPLLREPALVTPAQKANYASACRKIALDLAESLSAFDLPVLVNTGFFRDARSELNRPGVSASQAAHSGKALGATHVLTGTLTPFRTSRNRRLRGEIQLLLVDVETGQGTPLGKTHVTRRLGRKNIRRTAP